MTIPISLKNVKTNSRRSYSGEAGEASPSDGPERIRISSKSIVTVSFSVSELLQIAIPEGVLSGVSPNNSL
jgi:hypothetical protein